MPNREGSFFRRLGKGNFLSYLHHRVCRSAYLSPAPHDEAWESFLSLSVSVSRCFSSQSIDSPSYKKGLMHRAVALSNKPGIFPVGKPWKCRIGCFWLYFLWIIVNLNGKNCGFHPQNLTSWGSRTLLRLPLCSYPWLINRTTDISAVSPFFPHKMRFPYSGDKSIWAWFIMRKEQFLSIKAQLKGMTQLLYHVIINGKNRKECGFGILSVSFLLSPWRRDRKRFRRKSQCLNRCLWAEAVYWPKGISLYWFVQFVNIREGKSLLPSGTCG